MRSLTTTKHFHNRTTEGGGVGGGGVGGMITYLGLHTDTPKGGLVYQLWACTHAGPFWWVGVVFLLVYRLVESIYLLCLAVSRLKGV